MELKKEEFLEFLTEVFQCFLSDHKVNSFPGNLPISLQKQHLLMLGFGYAISQKVDGERTFIFIAQNHVFSINRNLDIQFLGTVNADKTHVYLFDAEMVANLNLILIFDTLVFQSINVLRTCITQRNELARNFLHEYGKPKKEDDFFAKIRYPSNYPHCDLTIENWVIEVKPLFQYHHLKTIYESQSRLPFDCDGLVFSRLWAAYKPFTQDPNSLIKWKEITTIDFLVLDTSKFTKLIDTKFPEFQIQNGNFLLACSSTEFFSFIDCDESFENKIVECKWQEDRWVPLKIRTDKKSPNKLTTVLKSLINIKDPIYLEDFIC